MIRLKFPARSFQVLLPLVILIGQAQTYSAADNSVLPPGIIEFAGRLAQHYPHLFEVGNRDAVAALNRELREAEQLSKKAQIEVERTAAMGRAVTASGQLLKQIKHSASLIRVDLASGRPAFVAPGPYQLPGRSGALLFEILASGDGLSFTNSAIDLSQENGVLVSLEAAASGTNYVLVGFEHLPTGRTTVEFEFRRSSQPPIRVPLHLVTPSLGRLKLTVLSDDTGKPVPAMVRLVWDADGQARQPGNGIELGPQFDNQSDPSGARRAILPAPVNETFWCVPGPVDMALDPGRWRIGIRRGVEHEVIFHDITVTSGETVEQTFRPRRWTDMRKRGWWSGDDHVHCRILSDLDARNLMAWVQAEDVHLANVVKMGSLERTFFEQRGFGPEYRVVDGEFVLVPGQECPRTHEQIGHTLAMNITSMVRDTDRYFLYDEVFDTVHAQGGLTGYAHVNSDMFFVHRDMTMNVPRQKADFAEILQFNILGTDLYYEFLNLGCKLTASAGSDVPYGGTIGEVRVYAYLGGKKFSADAWFAAFGRGRTFTTSGPMLELQVDDALPGDELLVKSAKTVRVRARAWSDPKRMGPVKLEIVRHGEVIRSIESQDTNKSEARLDFKVDAGHGCWIAARAWARDGTSAHTTPVYVVRKGLRFWKYDGLRELIDKRLASLDEIEGIVAEARRLDAEGKLESDRHRKQLALQGGWLLERVAFSRNLYAELKRVAEAESKLRSRQ